ncbi:MAG: cell division protein ZapA [Paludibacteraceae bacterium]|nr:cell division protein ZapA [Paludibacteraceae bacterium]
MSDKQHIVLKLGSNPVEMHINRELEPYYRRAANVLNERYEYFKQYKKNASLEQLWMYVALEMGTNLLYERGKSTDSDQLPIDQLNEEITKRLK